jgi:hypothetical protein
MKIKYFKYESKMAIQLYITIIESTDTTVLNKIEELKKQYDNNVVVFVSGTLETIPQLRQMIIHQKNLIKG